MKSIKDQFKAWQSNDSRCVLYLYSSSNERNTASNNVDMIFTTEQDALNRINSKDNCYASLITKMALLKVFISNISWRISMNKLFAIVFSLFMFVIPVTAFAQPVHYVPHPPVPYSHYKRVLYCYDVILPVPHSKCEYRYVRVNYMPAPPLPPRHHPEPPTHKPKPPHEHHSHHGHHK